MSTGDSTLSAGLSNGDLIVGILLESVPEKTADLEQLIADYKITFAINPHSKRITCTQAEHGANVEVGLKHAQRLMAHCYAYLTANFAEIEVLKAALTQEQVGASFRERLDAAGKLLTWAVHNELEQELVGTIANAITDLIDPDLALLIDTCLEEKHQPKAGELFAKAFSWIILHEIGHIVLKHHEYRPAAVDENQRAASVQQENEADRFAADWLLDCPALSPSDRWMRQAAIASVLGWRTAGSAYIGNNTHSTHPPGYARLWHITDLVTEPDEHDIWRFVQMILILHIHNRGISTPLPGGNPRSHCDELINILANQPNE